MSDYRDQSTQKFDSRQTQRAYTRKRRKKTSKRVLAVYWAFILGISMLLSTFIIVSVNDIFAFSKPDYSATIEIPENASAYKVGRILKKADIIEHPLLFSFFSGLTNKKEFVAGKHEPNASLDYRAIIRMLTRKQAVRETVRVTIPEGYNTKQIIELLVDKNVCDKAELEKALKDHEFDNEYVDTLKKGDVNRLEGYLFPDTYEFYVKDEAERVINKLLSNFNAKFTGEMRDRAKELGMSVHDVITLASVIEKEATAKDRTTIASVFHNRLKSKTYPYLESCATVQYALGTNKKVLTIEDTKVDSPYNTYQNPGLPKGPIASPGIASINAALYPKDTDYLFFALLEDGTHKFSKTYEEHLKVQRLNP